jgi:hypothetical protein
MARKAIVLASSKFLATYYQRHPFDFDVLLYLVYLSISYQLLKSCTKTEHKVILHNQQRGRLEVAESTSLGWRHAFENNGDGIFVLSR